MSFSGKETMHLVLQIKIPADVARQIETILKVEAISRGADSASEVCVVKGPTGQAF